MFSLITKEKNDNIIDNNMNCHWCERDNNISSHIGEEGEGHET